MEQNIITEKTLERGLKLLEKYREARSTTDARIQSDEEYFNTRHTGRGSSASSDMPLPNSAWMFSAIVNKHADMLDDMPEAVCLAREESDVPAAEALSAVLPVILERASFTEVYSRTQYDKLKHGTGVYGVFWNPFADNGIGEVEVRAIDVLSLYTEPGITDIEDSKNLFYISLMDEEEFFEKYPYAKDTDESGISAYFPQSVTAGKRVIIDWYYKKPQGTRTLLHYIKFSGNTLIYASENDPEAENGFYDHGRYPFVFDTLYNEAGSPLGYGLISVTRGSQSYIDKLDENLLERSIISSKPRYMLKKNVGLNRDEFLDFSNPIVEVEGDLSEERIKAITLPALDTSILDVRSSKIDEMREAAANRTVNYGESGGLSSGVAIAALQEAGNKVSRDIKRGSWCAFIKVSRLVIELIRQFYNEERIFRITAPNKGGYSYVRFSSELIREKAREVGGELFYRKPVFDIDVKAQSAPAFSKIARNEAILNLVNMGLFDSENTEKALIVLDALELDGKGAIIENLKKRAAVNERKTEKADTVREGGKLSEAAHSAVNITNDKC